MRDLLAYNIDTSFDKFILNLKFTFKETQTFHLFYTERILKLRSVRFVCEHVVTIQTTKPHVRNGQHHGHLINRISTECQNKTDLKKNNIL